jgi:hypothetical protein
MSNKRLKRYHREHPILPNIGLRAHARLVAKLYPRSPEGRAALDWLGGKCRACVRAIERELAERDAQMKRVQEQLFPSEKVLAS